MDLLRVYFEDVCRAGRILSAEEERAIGERIRSGDVRAVEELVLANLRLAVCLATRWKRRRRSQAELGDLIQECYFGLRRAAEKFDPSLGRFSTYATRWIRQRCQMAELRESVIYVPPHARRALAKGEKAGRKRREELRSARRALACVRMPIEDLAELAGREESGGDGGGELARIVECARQMDGRMREVALRHWGLDGGEPETLKAIGARMGLTKQRVHQLKNDALRVLRDRLSA